MDAMNTGFLAKQLLLTEMDGEVIDYKGGCLVMGDGVIRAGIWEPQAIADPEEYITDLQAKAEEFGVDLAGVVMLIPGAMEQEEKVVQLTEALFVYGFAPPEGDDAPPDMVQVCTKPTKVDDGSRLELKPITGADLLLKEAMEVPEVLYSIWNEEDLFTVAEKLLVSADGETIGLAMVKDSELAQRVVLLWVKEEHRGKGFGRGILAELNEVMASGGKLLQTVWANRTGKWRYFFRKCGFEEQLRALYFLPE